MQGIPFLFSSFSGSLRVPLAVCHCRHPGIPLCSEQCETGRHITHTQRAQCDSHTAKVCYKFKHIENFKSVRLPLSVYGCLCVSVGMCLCVCVCVRLFICLSTVGRCFTLTVPHFEATPNWFGICPWLIQAINAPVSLQTLLHTLTQTHAHSYAETFTRTVYLLFQWEIAGHFITKRVIGSNLFALS